MQKDLSLRVKDTLIWVNGVMRQSCNVICIEQNNKEDSPLKPTTSQATGS